MDERRIRAEIAALDSLTASAIAASLRGAQFRVLAELWFGALGVEDTREVRLVVADLLLDEINKRGR